MTVDTAFLDELASASPTPGGGGGAAYAGAVASALASMVANLTLGKQAYAAVEPEVEDAIARLAASRKRLLGLVDEDAAAFQPIADAYRMPSSTAAEAQAKHDAIQAGLPRACEVPLVIMGECISVMEVCVFLAAHGSRLAVSDAGAGAVVANGALQAASLNIYINADTMDDARQADRFRSQAGAMMRQGACLADDAYNKVAQKLGAPPLHETVGLVPAEEGKAS